jgi:mono/diheme cytochrome c family protein
MTKNLLKMRIGRLAVMSVLTVLPACALGRPEAPQPEVRIGPDVRLESGLALAERYCASCHAVTGEGDSPRPMAPPFRRLAVRFTGPQLDEALTMVSDLGHGEMPPARLDQAELRDLASYIDSLD